MSETPDLLRVLADSYEDARDARRKFERREAVNGRTALRKIEERCFDVLAEAHESGRLDYDPVEMP